MAKDNLRIPSTFLGLTVGLLVGFSISPAVGGVISSLLAGAFVLMSLVPDSSKLQINRSHIAAVPFFAVSLLVGAGGGLYLKSNGILFPSQVEIDFRSLVEIGVSESDARQAILSKFAASETNETSTGLHATSEIEGSLVGAIADANARILSTIHADENSDTSRLVRVDAGTIAYRLRDILEAELGAETALLWYKLHTADPEQQPKLLEDLQVNHREEYESIIGFFSPRS